jgi:hypothetical protein
LFTKTAAGKVVGKLFAEGGEAIIARVGSAFSSAFAQAGSKLEMKALGGKVLQLVESDFVHIVRRHMMPFWDGSKKAFTTFWPEEMLMSNVLEELTKVIPKSVIVEGWNNLVLRNGIRARIFVENGFIKTFFPVSGEGVIKSADIVAEFL